MAFSLYANTVGPYMGISRDETVTFKTDDGPRTFRLLLSGAYNAMGLIGSEVNGIVVLDEDKMNVLADCIWPESTGYYGPSDSQQVAFDMMKAMTWEEFRQTINKCERNRYTI